MQVIASKKMASVINKFFKEQNIPYSVDYFTTDINTYKNFVSYDIFSNEVDYLPASGKMRGIQIDYPSNYYAMPQYLTTRVLLRIYKTCDKTLKGFLRDVYEEIAI